MSLHIVTATELRAAGVELAPLEFAGPSVPMREAAYAVLPVALADLEPGDVPALCRHLGIKPRALILTDVYGTEEFSVPADAAECVIARASFRSYEAKGRFLPLPPIVEPFDALPFDKIDADAGFYMSLSTAPDVAVYDSLRMSAKPAPGHSLAGKVGKSWEDTFVAGLVQAGEKSFDAQGRMRIKLESAADPKALLEGARAAAQHFSPSAFRAHVVAVNKTVGAAPEPVMRSYGGLPVESELPYEERELLRQNDREGLLLNSGEVDPAELRDILRRSRCFVTTSRYGSLPAAAVQAASAGRACFVVGDVQRFPFDVDPSGWLFSIPRDVAGAAGDIVRGMSRDRELMEAAGYNARAWFERVARPECWGARLLESLS